MGDEIVAFPEAMTESDDPEPHLPHRPFGHTTASGQNGRCRMNRLDPSGELRAGFGETCEGADANSRQIMESYAYEKTS
jgi:hypothetical protein